MIIIVMGLPGSGKSYFAEKLSRRLEADYINSDQVRKAVGALGKYSVEDKMAIYRIMAEKAGQSLDAGKRVVVDATFYQRAMIDLFIEVAAAHLSPIKFIKVEASEDLIKERLLKPREDSEADFDVYRKIKEQFEELSLPHLNLHSDRDNINRMLMLAIDYIGEMHEGTRS